MPLDLSPSGVVRDDHATDEPDCDDRLCCVSGLEKPSQERQKRGQE